MFLFRALNELDILVNPLENGIASKKLLYDLTKTYNDSNPSKEYKELNSKEKDLYIKSYIKEYIKTHNYKLEKMFLKKTNDIRNLINDLNDIVYSDNGDVWAYYTLVKYLSTLNNHLVNG